MSEALTKLRQDITGLRAVAVLAVTLYHVAHVLTPENSYFKGGFLGVDIFFVISGFLMTKIIMTGMDRGNFSLYMFYKRRAKRICPALLVTVIVFVAAAILVLDNDALLKTCRDGLRALGFISNYWLSRQTGYFDGSATERLFLHTWSLSLEWQFYLVYPLLLILATKLVSRKMLGAILVLVTISSLIYGCVYTLQNPVNSYFYLTSRAYELLIGALAYFYPLSFFLSLLRANKGEALDAAFQEKIAKQVEYLGLLCIAVSLVVVDSTSGWPNPWSILPLFGTYLCIAADNKQTLLSNVVFQKLGLWSYAIYLVHWPVIVLFGNFTNQSVSWELLPLILVLGMALHYGVERRRNFGWLFLAFYFAIAVGLQWLIKTDATLFRDVPTISFPSGEIANDAQPTHIGNKERSVDFILTGDSFSRQYVGVVDQQSQHVIAVTLDDCVSTANFYVKAKNHDQAWYEKCQSRYTNLLEVVHRHPRVPVVWAQNWYGGWDSFYRTDTKEVITSNVVDVFKQDLQKILRDLKETNTKLYLVGFPYAGDQNTDARLGKKCYPLHRMDNVLSRYLWRVLGCSDVVILDEVAANQELQVLVDRVNQAQGSTDVAVEFVNPSSAYCDEKACRVMVEGTYEPYFFDGSHLSKYGAERVLLYVMQLMDDSDASKQD